MRKPWIAATLLLPVLGSCGQNSFTPSSSAPRGSSASKQTESQPWKKVTNNQPYDSVERPPTSPFQGLRTQALGKDIPHYGSARRFPNPGSTTVVGDTTGNADNYTGGTITINIPIRRYVGNVDRALSNKTLSSSTQVSFPVFDVDEKAPGCAERDTAYLNGQLLGDVHGDNDIWQMQTFNIDTRKLNFPRTPGETAHNTFTLQVDTGGCEQWLASVDWVALKFKAAAPVVMVHGILSKGSVWDGAKAFFESKGLVADDSITLQYNDLDKDAITSPRSCKLSQFNTVTRNSRQLINEFKRIAQLYGTDELNIIGHSKGGIDSKAAIQKVAKSHTLVSLGEMNGQPVEAPLKFNSLITLNTPHLGAPAADLGVLKVLEDNKLARDGNFKDLIGVSTGLPFHPINSKIVRTLLSKDHLCDLTTQRATVLNDKYPIDIPVFATGTEAAAHPNADHSLPATDTSDMAPGAALAAGTLEKLYRYTGTNRSLTYHRITVSNWFGVKREVFEADRVDGDWIPNDVIVTTESAAGSNLPMVINGLEGQNHTRVNRPGPVIDRVTQEAFNGAYGVKWTVNQ